MSRSSTPTLLEVLRERFPEASARTLRQMLAADRVRVNGVPERVAKRPIAEGDRVEVGGRTPALDPRLRILHEDEHLIVVEKAAGLLSGPHAAEAEDTAETLLDRRAGGRPGRQRVFHVHRLDRDTSGILVFAKGEFARDRLQDLFAAHDIERGYVAVVHGRPRPAAGTLRCFLAEGGDLRVRRVASAALGKEAVTRYRTLAAGQRYAALELELETGRRHQIRVQLADAGHAVLGDPLYGPPGASPLGRLALHAHRLAFVHPATGKRLELMAEPPPGFRSLAL
jgi:23S rRNA pseudouridine1911/1915/1917 synthase